MGKGSNSSLHSWKICRNGETQTSIRINGKTQPPWLLNKFPSIQSPFFIPPLLCLWVKIFLNGIFFLGFFFFPFNCLMNLLFFNSGTLVIHKNYMQWLVLFFFHLSNADSFRFWSLINGVLLQNYYNAYSGQQMSSYYSSPSGTPGVYYGYYPVYTQQGQSSQMQGFGIQYPQTTQYPYLPQPYQAVGILPLPASASASASASLGATATGLNLSSNQSLHWILHWRRALDLVNTNNKLFLLCNRCSHSSRGSDKDCCSLWAGFIRRKHNIPKRIERKRRKQRKG